MMPPESDNARRARPGEVGENQSELQAGFYYPTPATVKGRTLGALLRGERLTHLDCWLRFGSARLSHHVYMLRAEGWPVLCENQTVTTSDAGRPALIGVYSLSADVIANAGDQGRQFAADTARIELERRVA